MSKFKVATWNINSINARLSHLINWLESSNIDIVLLQELKCTEEKFPYEQLDHLGYNIAVSGQKSYNGTAILSKTPIEETVKEFEGNPLPEEARYIDITTTTSIGVLRLASIYFPNGGEINSGKFQDKLKFYDSLSSHARRITSSEELALFGGDMNIAPYEIDVYSPEALKDSTGFSQEERLRWRSFVAEANLEDCFRVINPDKIEFSWWDYRGSGFRNNQGMRIDHLLASPKLIDKLDSCYIDKTLREQKKPSDHAPVICEFAC